MEIARRGFGKYGDKVFSLIILPSCWKPVLSIIVNFPFGSQVDLDGMNNNKHTWQDDTQVVFKCDIKTVNRLEGGVKTVSIWQYEDIGLTRVILLLPESQLHIQNV